MNRELLGGIAQVLDKTLYTNSRNQRDLYQLISEFNHYLGMAS
jgi:hypothetical protein